MITSLSLFFCFWLSGLGISAKDFVCLTLIKIKLILPQPQFPTFRLISFIDNYITFMKDHNFVRVFPSVQCVPSMRS